MAEAEWKAPVTRLDDITLVHARILERLEQKYDDAIHRHDEAIRKHDEEIGDLRTGLIKLMAAVQKTNDAVQIMNSSMNGLFERWDRFMRGQEGNGHKQ